MTLELKRHISSTDGVFHGLGLIEQWGRGAQRMTGACTEMGLAPPRFEEIATPFYVTIPTERVRPSVWAE
jgi:predicted HTH transcriptional regulator